MKNKICLLIIVMFSGLQLSAQSQVENMLRDAKKYNKAYLENDFTTFVSMTIPSIVELAGGKEIMEKVSKEQYETMTSVGLEFISFKPTKPSKIMFGGEDLHAILPQELITKIGKDKFMKTAYFLASSNDDGQTWTFVDLEPYDQESIKTFVPSFSGELEIPKVEFAEKLD